MDRRSCLVCRSALVKLDGSVSEKLWCNIKGAFVHQNDSCKNFEALAPVKFADNYRAALPQTIAAK